MLIPTAPENFEGELVDLYDSHIKLLLPPKESLQVIHEVLKEYCEQEDAVFYVRHRTDEKRGNTELGSDGTPYVPTDNSPACWMHRLHYQGVPIKTSREFAELIKDMPCHFFQVAKCGCNHLYTRNWYIAHLLRAKPARSRKIDQTRDVLKSLFIRSVHPINHFFLPDNPKGIARKIEGDHRVLAYISQRHRERYEDIWDEFLQLAGFDAVSEIRTWGPPPQSHRIGSASIFPPKPYPQEEPIQNASGGDVAVRYQSSRLAFRANLIEPLAWDDRFQIDTPQGSFIMSKREFYDVFANIVASRSYTVDKNYNSKNPPSKAMQFLVKM